MTIRDLFEETHTALSANKIRTGLTMLGIIIGIGSVIAMVAVGAGAQNSIQASIQSIGSNLILVIPGAQRTQGYQINNARGSAKTVTGADGDAAAKLSLAKAVAPEITGRYQVTAKGTNTNTSVVGTNSLYATVRNVNVAEGDFITDQQVKNISKVAVIGPTVRDDLFGEGATDVIGKAIRIKGIEFKIIGITTAKGGTGFGNQDDMIFIPLSSAARFLSGNNYLTTFSIQALDADSMATLQADVTSLLLERHKIADAASADFNVINQSDIVATASSVTGTFTILLAAVAGISLIVGGIGIMNMMLTTVTERTREIGLRKAIGAKGKDISLQFLTEAIVLTFIGGIAGVILGWSISLILAWTGLIQAEVSVSSVLLAFGVSALIGIAFGYYPAKRAANMNPIEALRYE